MELFNNYQPIGFVVEKNKFNISIWRQLFDYCSHYHGQFRQLIAIMLGFSFADVMIPWLMKYGIDEFITPKTTEGLPTFIGLIALAVFFRSFLVFVMIRVGGLLNVEVAYKIRQDCFTHIQKLSLSYFDYRPVGWLMSRITSDCRTLGGALSWGIVDIIFGFAMMFLITVIMLIMSFKLALLVLLIIPILLWVSYFFKKYILHAFREVREYNAQVSGSFNEGVSGAGTTKLLVQENNNFESFKQITDQMASASINAATKSSIYLPLILLIGSIGTALALWNGGTYVFEFQSSNGSLGISYGTLVAFIAYTIKFFQPIQDIARRFSELQNAQAAAERIFEVLATEPKIKDGESTVQPTKPLTGTVDIENLKFSYSENEPLFENFHLKIKAGECVALVGETGSGKTTLTNLIARFYEPTGGQIKLDGIDYTKLPLLWIHQQLGIILQTPHLFRGTIAENIAYGRNTVDLPEIKAAAKRVNAHPFIQRLPGGYDFKLGEGGSGISVGQKQLLTFARAILIDPQIMIMDEATSSIDTETEQLIQEATNHMLENRTSIIVAHRLSTIQHADRIVVLSHGKIVEVGNHDFLLKKRGVYFNLYSTQFSVNCS